MGLAKKLAAVAAACAYVQKDSANTFHKYRYASAANILGHVNEALYEAGLAVVGTEPTILSETGAGKERVVTVRMVVTVADCEGDERAQFVGLGSGMDAGDKAVMKACTAALKYAWLGALSISTGDDPEADEDTDRRTERGGRQNATQQRSTTRTPSPAPECDQDLSTRAYEPVLPPPGALVRFEEGLRAIKLPGEGVSLWRKHRRDLEPLTKDQREGAWEELCKTVERVGKMKNAKTWLRKAVQEEDARATKPESTGPGLAVARPEDDEPPPTGTGPGKSTPKNTAANGTGSSAVGSTGSSPRARAWTEEEVCSLPQAWEAHLRRKPHVLDPANARGRTSEYAELASGYLKRREAFQAAGISDEALDILRAELRVRGCMEPDALLAGVIGRRQKAA